MVGIDEAAQIAAGLPGVTEGTSYGNRAWFIGKTAFAWERSFRKADLRRFGAAPVPAGPTFAGRVAGLTEKDAVLAKRTRGVFTIPHFDGYAAVLVQARGRGDDGVAATRHGCAVGVCRRGDGRGASCASSRPSTE